MYTRQTSLPCALLSLVMVASGNVFADWPTYRHDFARSGVTDETLSFPLHRQWTHMAQPPRPAWPEPGRELNRLAFDYAYAIVIGGDKVYFGSSADDQVHCVDLTTGQELWTFFTQGPVRFAPALADGLLFAGSDDGWLYCLSADSGKLLWRFRGGPEDRRLMGNGRMISRWPLRSGVGVSEGIVYFAAGMWPSEGVRLYALRAADGSVVFERQLAAQYRKQPHPGSFSMIEVSPQGCIVGTDDYLFLPTGRNAAAAYDRANGKERYYHSAPYSWSDRWGGTLNFAVNGLFVGWRTHPGPDMPVTLTEFAPDPNDGLVLFDAASGKLLRDLPGGGVYGAIDGDTLYVAGRANVRAYDLPRLLKGAPAVRCIRWQAEHGRAYALIVAGNSVLVGGASAITAFDADTGKQLWQDQTDGQVRDIAASDGRLLASTTTGRIICYGAATVEQPPVVQAAAAFRALETDPRWQSVAERILAQTRKREGVCLALGTGDGELLYELAQQSKLIIYSIDDDEQRAESVRRRLAATGLYGDRIAVHHGRLDRLPYPDMFADLIVSGEGDGSIVSRCRAKEVYRVLHPYGGVAHLFARGAPGGSAALGEWMRKGGAPPAEVEVASTAMRVVRGPLPGADNWTHQYGGPSRTGSSNDQRVKLPLRLLWFGDPGPARMVSRHWGGPAPLCVDGRLFVVQQNSVTAVDAFNGRQLWRYDHDSPVARWPVRTKGAGVVAEGDSVYIGIGDKCLRLDAASGQVRQTYPLPQGGGNFWTCLAVRDDVIVGGAGDATQARLIFALGKDGAVRWTHRPQGAVSVNGLCLSKERVYLLDRPDPIAAAAARRRGETPASRPRLVALALADGAVVWETEAGVGNRTELWLGQDVLVASSNNGLTGYSAADGRRLYSRDARLSRFPVIVGDTIVGEPVAWDLHTGAPKERLNPFTAQPVSWSFLRSYGCGSIAAGPHLLMFRSGTLGFYDLTGDSGVYNFAGIRAGCYVNAIAANGLVLAPPADAGCTCSYSLQTTVALAPTTKQEDWSIFYDRLPNTAVQHARFNLGAPGDHRDADGSPWLAAPRPKTRRGRIDLSKPFRFEFYEGGGAYHYDSDYVEIKGAKRPWLYAHGLKGLKRAELDLTILDRGLSSWPAQPSPDVDGRLDDACWDGYRAAPVPAERATMTFRHDAENLYVAYRSPRRLDESGKPRPWRATQSGDDAKVWQDDSVELFFAGVPLDTRDNLGSKCLHLGVSASGARYDALWKWVQPKLPTVDAPPVEVTIDGDSSDWGDDGVVLTSMPGMQGKLRPERNFDAGIRLGWTERGLALLAHIKDSRLIEDSADNRLWQGDSVEVFVTPKLGSGDAYQCAIAPGVTEGHPKARWRFYDYRKASVGARLSAEAAGSKTEDGYLLEILLPWSNLSLTPADGLEFGIQVLVNDQDDSKLRRPPFRAVWHPAEHPISRKNPWAYQTVRLSQQASAAMHFTRSAKPGPDGLFFAVPPFPFPLTIPAIGAEPEKPDFNAIWASRVQVDEGAFTVELAIPWRSLESAGLKRSELVVDWNSRGPLARRPTNTQGFERLRVASEDMVRPRHLDLRLHFVDMENAEPGRRVFDVRLQGKTVLAGLDIAREAGGSRRAMVRDIPDLVVSRALILELIPAPNSQTTSLAPVICGIEMSERRQVE